MSVIHLCIDMQIMGKIQFHSQEWGYLKRKIVSLVKHLDDRKIPTVYVAYGRGFVPFANGVGYLKNTPPETNVVIQHQPWLGFDLPLKPDSLVAYKHSYSAYDESSIANYVKMNGFRTIILSGVFEGILTWDRTCVSATAQGFGQQAQAGYDVVLAAEATHRGIPFINDDYRLLVDRKKFHKNLGSDVLPMTQLMANIDRDRHLAPEMPEPVSETSKTKIFQVLLQPSG